MLFYNFNNSTVSVFVCGSSLPFHKFSITLLSAIDFKISMFQQLNEIMYIAY